MGQYSAIFSNMGIFVVKRDLKFSDTMRTFHLLQLYFPREKCASGHQAFFYDKDIISKSQFIF